MNICFIGGGNMATALISGLLQRGYTSSKIHVVEINPQACVQLHEKFSVRASTELEIPVQHADVLILAVKPQQLREVSLKIAALIKNQLVISIAAGIRASDLARWLGSRNVVRCMPNTPALIRSGITGLYALPEVDSAQQKVTESILSAVGKFLWVTDEVQLNSVTALSGSGPAYVFYFIEAMQQAGLELGLDVHTTRELAIETIIGAGKLARSSDEDVTVLRARVTSKNGTTERALLSMEESQVKAHIVSAIHAAAERANEMGDELGKQ